MREMRMIMGMPVIVEIADKADTVRAGLLFREVFDYFTYIDEKFSTYKSTSEISAINNGQLALEDSSADMKEIFALSETTKKETGGYFDIVNREGKYDPSGIVKGWAVWNAGKILKKMGADNFFIDAGGDVQTSGKNAGGKPWSVGIADPFQKNYGGTVMTDAPSRVVKVIHAGDGEGIATSGTAIRGQHIYNPHRRSGGAPGIPGAPGADDGIHDIVSLTVIGPDIYEADRFATAAFAMGKKGIDFIENIRLGVTGQKLEGYMIDLDGMAVMTSGFERYTL